MAKLINGNGNRAIYAAQDADLIASLAGNVTCIANVGNKYAATIEDANTIGLADGVIITKEGRRIQLDAGNVDLFAIPTGSSGVTNYYIIGYKLVQQADSSQVAETFVQKMNSSSATIAEGTLRGGDNEVYVSVYRVTQVGFNIDSVDGLLPELTNISQINSDLTGITSFPPSGSEVKIGENRYLKHIETSGNLTANTWTTFGNVDNGNTAIIKSWYVKAENAFNYYTGDGTVTITGVDAIRLNRNTGDIQYYCESIAIQSAISVLVEYTKS